MNNDLKEIKVVEDLTEEEKKKYNLYKKVKLIRKHDSGIIGSIFGIIACLFIMAVFVYAYMDEAVSLFFLIFVLLLCGLIIIGTITNKIMLFKYRNLDVDAELNKMNVSDKSYNDLLGESDDIDN